MSKNDDANVKRAAAREAREQGKSASEVGASTGAGKQIDTKADNTAPRGGKS